MMQADLLEKTEAPNGHFDLGRGYSLHLPHGPRRPGKLYHHGQFNKPVNLADRVERRVFVVELLQKNLNQTRLAEVLNLSRQTLHNYRESYRKFGVTGLVHGYSPSASSSAKVQARIHVSKRRPGTKARELEAMRRSEMERIPGQDELAWDGDVKPNFNLEEPPLDAALQAIPLVGEVSEMALEPFSEAISDDFSLATDLMAANEQAGANAAPTQKYPDMAATPAAAPAIELPYTDNHDWEASRYAGIFPILMALISHNEWITRLFRLFGGGWCIFHVFALMAACNIRSIEQLKHVRREEAGRILGLRSLPGRDTVWSWFYGVAKLKRADALLKSFFADQIRNGLVGCRLWFTDGHLLPYTGQEKVHSAWNTQRKMPVPGQTNLVTCDERGRIVYFDIQEGKGDLRGQIRRLGDYARQQSLGVVPVHVFDREGNGLGFFYELIQSRIPFITWEKNADQPWINALPEANFIHAAQVNGTSYRLLEEVKNCTYSPDAEPDVQPDTVPPDAHRSEPKHQFNLRRVVAWNQRTGHRVAVLCWDAGIGLTTEEVAIGMLSRWGASENTFKHIQERHPYHYRPGFAVSESDKQDIVNPQIAVLTGQIKSTQRHLAKLYKSLAKVKPSANKDGSERTNCRHRRLSEEIAVNEAKLKQLQSDKAQLPERVDVTGLADYRSFNVIDNEGKKLFDFVTSSVWNVRRQILDWLSESYANKNDRVDLLYAILNCHGWVRSDARWVVVRLEPLQQPARRSAQEYLCRKLSGLGARIPGGKWLRVEVGDSPL